MLYTLNILLCVTLVYCLFDETHHQIHSHKAKIYSWPALRGSRTVSLRALNECFVLLPIVSAGSMMGCGAGSNHIYLAALYSVNVITTTHVSSGTS